MFMVCFSGFTTLPTVDMKGGFTGRTLEITELWFHPLENGDIHGDMRTQLFPIKIGTESDINDKI